MPSGANTLEEAQKTYRAADEELLAARDCIHQCTLGRIATNELRRGSVSKPLKDLSRGTDRIQASWVTGAKGKYTGGIKVVE
jgi:hypothetical protein